MYYLYNIVHVYQPVFVVFFFVFVLAFVMLFLLHNAQPLLRPLSAVDVPRPTN